jgi:CTP synthase
MPTKYVVVLGSLLSGLGKGIVTASLAKLLSMHGLNAMPLKFDGYLNYDCGTMNPFRHGEVFVLDDKSEVDMDFGTYERFLNTSLKGEFSLTGGKIFSAMIEMERRGDFLGNDVQFVPHVAEYIIGYLKGVAARNRLDVLLIEVGGTVGDIENGYFIEAMRELALRERVIFVNLTYVPELGAVGEQKTKPTQIALRNMMQFGIQPSFIICRSENALSEAARNKVALFANVDESAVIDDQNSGNIYRMPLHLMEQGLDSMVMKSLGLKPKADGRSFERRAASWGALCDAIDRKGPKVDIAIVGKYTQLHDAYASVKEAIVHAAGKNMVSAEVHWIDSEMLEKSADSIPRLLDGMDGMIVPGGFGKRGIEGMISAISYARTKRIPYLGLCLGMQLMAVEFARNVCGLWGANSAEFDSDTKHRIVDILPGQEAVTAKGGTMRLGLWTSRIEKGTMAYAAYKSENVSERHRHRYEINNAYRETLTKAGIVVSAVNADRGLVEMLEWRGSFGIGTQAHPELESRLEMPNPLFISFIRAAKKRAAAR